MIRVLVVSNNSDLTKSITEAMYKSSGSVISDEVTSLPEAHKLAKTKKYEVIIVDLSLGWDDGIAPFTTTKELAPDPAYLVIVPNDDLGRYMDCISEGAIECFYERNIPNVDLLSKLTISIARNTIFKEYRERERRLKKQLIIRNKELMETQETLQRELADRKTVEQILEMEKNYFAELFENSQEGVVLCDNHSFVEKVNFEFQRLFGFTEDEVVGKRIDDLLAPHDDIEAARYATQVVMEGERVQFEAIRKRKDGALIDVRVLASPIMVNGDQVGVYGIYTDITEAKNTEKEMEDFTNQLEELNKQLVKANKMKDEFLSNTSHELRTPLNCIIGLLKLLEDGLYENEEEQVEFVKMANENSHHLLSIINDLLDMARIESGKMKLEDNEVSTDDLFADVEMMFKMNAQKKNIILDFNNKAPEIMTFRSDMKRMKQILTNLIGNSLKFTSKGSITITAEAYGGRDRLLFEVKDTGDGIDMDDMNDLFEPFVQEDGSTKRKYGGTGLGLSICHKLVEAMGGEIWIESEGKGKGTSVNFTVPTGEMPVNNGGA